MMRRNDWQPRLVAYLDACRGQAYAVGRFDCALFAAGAVEAMTGLDLASDWRGRYRTLRGGLRVLRAAGYVDHLALARAHFAPVPVAFAQSGDLAAANGPEGVALGVVVGPHAHFLHVERGLIALPLTQAREVFRV